ncbi:hypothetical protein [Streptacidiphilus sp. MAP5-52]|uniref:hypothetical protein n=1 Tax=Streptacidiphilus sp. MAP5-52 TaxID=3156267 RepID=UPI003512B94C
MPDQPEPFVNNEPPWGDQPLPSRPAPVFPAAEELENTFDAFDGIEIMESHTVGTTTYYRGFQEGTDRESLYAQRDSGELEVLLTDDGGSPSSMYRYLTGPDAPKDLYGQLQAEQDYFVGDAEAALEQERFEEKVYYEAEVWGLQDDLGEGRITQDQYDQRFAELQPVRDRIALDDMAVAEEQLGTEIPAAYEAELAADGITAAPLAEMDFGPEPSAPEPPQLPPPEVGGMDMDL